MKNGMALGALIGLAVTAGWIRDASASYPVGVWTHVDKLVFDNPADPTTIEIHGALMLYNGDMATKYPGYSEPALGYMYYACPAGKKATCQMEWADLQANIGTPIDQCLGFGDQVAATGTFRKSCDPPMNPDPYPIAMGVLSGFTPCQVIKDYLATNPTDGCGGGAASSSSAAASSSTSASSGSGSSSSGKGSTTASSTGATSTSGAGGGSSSGGGSGSGCSFEAAPQDGAGLGGLSLAIAVAGFSLRRRATRLRVR